MSSNPNSLLNFSFSTIGQPPSLLQRMGDGAGGIRAISPSPSPAEVLNTSSNAQLPPLSRPSLPEILTSQNNKPFQEINLGSINSLPSSSAPVPSSRRQPLASSGIDLSSGISFTKPPPSSISQSLPEKGNNVLTSGSYQGLPPVSSSATFPLPTSSATDLVRSPVSSTNPSSCGASTVTSMDANSSFPIQSPADVYALTQLAQVQMEWHDLNILSSRFAEDLEELKARQSEVDRAAKRATDQTAKVISLSKDILHKIEALRKVQEKRWETERLRMQNITNANTSGHTGQRNDHVTPLAEQRMKDHENPKQDGHDAQLRPATQGSPLSIHAVQSNPTSSDEVTVAARSTESAHSERSAGMLPQEKTKEAEAPTPERAKAQEQRDEELRERLRREQYQFKRAQVEAEKKKAHLEEAARIQALRERKALEKDGVAFDKSATMTSGSMASASTINTSNVQNVPFYPPVHVPESAHISVSKDAPTPVLTAALKAPTNRRTTVVSSENPATPSGSLEKAKNAQKHSNPAAVTETQNPTIYSAASDTVPSANSTWKHSSDHMPNAIRAFAPRSSAQSQTSVAAPPVQSPQLSGQNQSTAANVSSKTNRSSSSAMAPNPTAVSSTAVPIIKTEQVTPRVPKVAKPHSADVQTKAIKREQSLDYAPLPSTAQVPVPLQASDSMAVPHAAEPRPLPLVTSSTPPSLQSRVSAMPSAFTHRQQPLVGDVGSGRPSVSASQTSVPSFSSAPQAPINKVSLIANGNPPSVTPIPTWGSSPHGPPPLPSFPHADKQSLHSNSRDPWDDAEAVVDDMGMSAWSNAPDTSGWEWVPSNLADNTADEEVRDNAARHAAVTPPREDRVPQGTDDRQEQERSQESRASRRGYDHYSPAPPNRLYDHYSPNADSGRRYRPSLSPAQSAHSAGAGYKRPRDRDEDRSSDEERYHRRPRVPSGGDGQPTRRIPNSRRDVPRSPPPPMRQASPQTPPRQLPRTDTLLPQRPTDDIPHPAYGNDNAYDTRALPPRPTDRYPDKRSPPLYGNTHAPPIARSQHSPVPRPVHEIDLLARLEMAGVTKQRARGSASIPLSNRIQDDDYTPPAVSNRPLRGKGRSGFGRGEGRGVGRGGGGSRANRSLAKRISG